MSVKPEPQTAFEPHDHHHCIEGALIHAEALAVREGLRLTPVRRRTLEILLERHGAIGAYDVLERLKAEGFGHQPPVAYRALDFLVEHGLAHRIRRLNAFVACAHPGHELGAVFLICEGCASVAEMPASSVREVLDQNAETVGFQVARASVEAVGLCGSCATQSADKASPKDGPAQAREKA